MAPREIIVRTLEHRGPERIGMIFSGGRQCDVVGAGISPSPTWTEKRWTEGQYEYRTDEWGSVWHRIVGKSSGGEIFRPALADWSALKDLRTPDFDNPARYEAARKGFADHPDRYRMGGLPGFPFAVCRYLRKMEVYFQDLLLERERIDELHERVTGLLERMIGRWADAGADGIFFCEDWGTQERLLVSPGMWREIFKPLFARLCGAAHAHKLHVIMHSCGYNQAILADLAEVGIDCFQFDQPRLYGLERLAAQLKELNVVLYAPVDIQQVMPTGDRARIEGDAELMVELFGRGSGLIAKDYPDLKGIGVLQEWDDWAYAAFRKHGRLSP